MDTFISRNIEKNLDPRNQNAQKVSIIKKNRAKILKMKKSPKRRQIGGFVDEKVIKTEHDIMRF